MTSLAPVPLAGASRIVFLGTPEIAVPYLEALVKNGFNVELVVTRPDVRRARGNEVSASPVKIAAQKLGIQVTHDPSDVLKIATSDASLLGVVVAFGESISTKILSCVPMINVHFSLLPRWRGAAPVERAILAGDDVTGVCIMRVVTNLDEGEVFVQHEVVIDPEQTATDLKEKLNAHGVEMLVSSLKTGLGDGVPQFGEALYAKKISSSDLKIDWRESVEHISRQVRLGGAFTFVSGRRVKILKVKKIIGVSPNFAPGEIAEMGKSVCVVAAGNGSISIEQVQPEGKAVMHVEQWLNGARLTRESVFGS